MCARNAKALLLLALLLAPCAAEAKKWTFETGIPLSLGLEAGITTNPDTDLTVKPQSTSTGFSHFFGIEPLLDFGNFALGAYAQWHRFPVVSASGTGTGGAFSETSDVGSVSFGGHIYFMPFVSETRTRRGYIKLGFGQAIAQVENVRNYTSGSAFTEKAEGLTREMMAGIGFEFMLAQNYSMKLESGFRQVEFERFEYEGGTDLEGTAKDKGTALLNTDGTQKKLNPTGPYFSLGLNFNF